MDGEKTGFIELVPMCLGAMLLSVIALKVVVAEIPQHPLLEVGDIVEFDVAHHFPPAPGSLRASPDGASWESCTLEAEAIHRAGASMVVTRVEADMSRYGIHWVSAGPTSERADCGRDALLTVDPATLMGLYSTADRANGQFIMRDMNPATGVPGTMPPAFP